MHSFRVSFHNPQKQLFSSGNLSGKYSEKQSSASNKEIKKKEPLANQEIPLERKFSKIILRFPKEFPKLRFSANVHADPDGHTDHIPP